MSYRFFWVFWRGCGRPALPVGRKLEGMKKYYADIKDKVLEKTASVKEITKETYGNVVDAVVEGYKSSRKITASEAAEIKEDLKEGYDKIKAVFFQNRPA
jgi:hypothetical protein